MTTIAAGGIFEIVSAAAGSLWLLYLARLLTGMCAGNVATASALIADSTETDQRSRGMAIVGISFGIGFTIGPALGAGVALLPEAFPAIFWEGAGLLGTGLPFAVAGMIALGTALLGHFILVEPDRRAQEGGRGRLSDRLSALVDHPNSRRVLLMCTLFFAYTAASSMLEVSFFPYARAIYGFAESEVGLIFAGMGLLLAIVQGGVGRISDRIGNRRMTLTGVLLLVVGLALAPVYPPLWFLLAFVAVATVGRALVHPGILSMTSSLASDDSETGKIMGILQSSSSLGRIIGHAAGGLLFEYLSPAAPFWGAAAAMAAAGSWWWLRSAQRRTATEHR